MKGAEQGQIQLRLFARQDGPVVERASPLWHAAVFDDLIEDACFVAIKNGEYAALSSLRPHNTPRSLWLDLRGVADGHRAHEIDLILALTQREVVYAPQHGVTTLQAGIDIDDPQAMLLLQHLPFSTGPAWITFRRERS